MFSNGRDMIKCHSFCTKTKTDDDAALAMAISQVFVEICVTSFFFFPHNVSKGFYSRVFNPFQKKPLFLCVCNMSFKTLKEKEKLLETSDFSFSHSVFYPFVDFLSIFINFKIIMCKLFWYR